MFTARNGLSHSKCISKIYHWKVLTFSFHINTHTTDTHALEEVVIKERIRYKSNRSAADCWIWPCFSVIDFCSSNPCEHGSCLTHLTGFHCTCDDGYYGHNCSKGQQTLFRNIFYVSFLPTSFLSYLFYSKIRFHLCS